MNQQTPSYRLFVGIDVAARSCTLSAKSPFQSPSPALTFEQSSAGFDLLLNHLLSLETESQAILVVLDATGTYWMRLALHLVAAEIAVAVVNPQQAHDFAKALLKRSKTDAIDAQMLAEFAARFQPKVWTPPPAVSGELHQRLAHRDALVDARTQFRNQLHALERQPRVVSSVRKRLEDLITTLNEQIQEVDTEISRVLDEDEAWAAAAS